MNIVAWDYDMTSKKELKWFSDQQPDLSYFIRDEQKDTLGDLVDTH